MSQYCDSESCINIQEIEVHLNFEDYLNLVLMQFSKLVFRFSWLLLHII